MSIQIYKDFRQRSPEWYRVRMGIPTTSEAATILRMKGRGADGTSKTRRDYLYKLAGEIITGRPMESYCNGHMLRGQENETPARALYALMEDVRPEQVAFIRAEFENGACGCSPDGLIDNDGMVELKDALPHIQIERLLANRLPPEHEPQCMMALLVAQREWIDFVSHCDGMRLFVKRVYRDEKRIAEIKLAVERFNYELHELVETIKRAA